MVLKGIYIDLLLKRKIKKQGCLIFKSPEVQNEINKEE